MTEKKRWTHPHEWSRIFKEENGIKIDGPLIWRRLEEAGKVGKTVRLKTDRIFTKGFFLESDVREVCSDFLNPMNEIYFNNPENVKTDLEAYAKKLGEGKTPLDLNNSKEQCTNRAMCINMENITWGTYLDRASKIFKLSWVNALKKLLHVAGYTQTFEPKKEYPPMDESYFNNPENVRADLEAYAKKLGEGKTSLDLNHSKEQYSNRIVCTNGEPVAWQSYLNKARKIFNLNFSNTLRKLIKIAGFEPKKEYPPMDESYFNNPENVRADLEAYANELGEGETPLNLGTSTITDRVACSNGKLMKWKSYLSRASKIFKLSWVNALKKLLHVAGYTQTFEPKKEYPPMDESYFNNPENVRADLEAYAKELGEGKTLLDLTTSNGGNSTTCFNGEPIQWASYLNRAAVVFGFAKTTKEIGPKQVNALKKLLHVAGYIQTFEPKKEYPPMDESYFNNPENVRADFEAYAKKLGEGKTSLDLRNSQKQYSNRVMCANHEPVRWGTYLDRTRKSFNLSFADTLKKLLYIAGY